MARCPPILLFTSMLVVCSALQPGVSKATIAISNAAKWDNYFDHLITFVEYHGHANVPQAFVSEDSYPLGLATNRAWSRGDYLNHRPERRELLDSLGFVWNSQTEARARFLRAALEYR